MRQGWWDGEEKLKKLEKMHVDALEENSRDDPFHYINICWHTNNCKYIKTCICPEIHKYQSSQFFKTNCLLFFLFYKVMFITKVSDVFYKYKCNKKLTKKGLHQFV